MAQRSEFRVGERRAVLPIGWDEEIRESKIVKFLGEGTLTRLKDSGMPVIEIEGVEIEGVDCWHMPTEEWASVQEENERLGNTVSQISAVDYRNQLDKEFGPLES